MSLLSKIFIFLVLLAAAFSAFVTATLYFHRQDFRDKWIREAHEHARGAQLKDAEISHLRNVVDHQESVIEMLHRKNSSLETEISGLQTQLQDAQRQLAAATAEKGELVEALRQQMAQAESLLVLVDRLREQIAQLRNERDVAVQQARNSQAELLNVRNELEILQRELARAEERLIQLARENNRLTGIVDHVRRAGFQVDAEVGAPVDGFVRGVDPETKLVVISVGQEAGVRVGQEFTIYRDRVYVAKVKVERVDRDWAAGRYELDAYVPRVGDRVSNRIMQGQAAAPGAGR